MLSFLNNWKWEMRHEKQNVQWKCAKIVQSLHYNKKTLFALDLLCFYSKVCSSNKKPENKLYLLRKLTCFLLIRWQIFEDDFDYIRKTLTFCSTVDVQLGSKYVSAYIYVQVSRVETIYILNILAVKYIFPYKRRMK